MTRRIFMIKMQNCLHLTWRKFSPVFYLMHKTDFHCKYDIQFLILEERMRFIVDNIPAASKWEQNIVLPSSGVRANIRDRIKIIYFKVGCSKSLNLDLLTLSYIMSLKLFFVDSVSLLFPFGFFTYFACQSVVIPLWKLDTCQTMLQELSIHGRLAVMFLGKIGVEFCWWGVEKGKVEIKSGVLPCSAQGDEVQWWTQIGGQENCLLIAVRAVRSLTLKGSGCFWLCQRKQLMYGWNRSASTRNVSVQRLWCPSM